MAVVMFALSITIYDIFANQIKRQKFDLENDGQGQGGENITYTIRLEMFEPI